MCCNKNVCVSQVTCSSSLGFQGSLSGEGSGSLLPSCPSTNPHSMALRGVQVRHSHSLAGHRDVRAGWQLSPDPADEVPNKTGEIVLPH